MMKALLLQGRYSVLESQEGEGEREKERDLAQALGVQKVKGR